VDQTGECSSRRVLCPTEEASSTPAAFKHLHQAFAAVQWRQVNEELVVPSSARSAPVDPSPTDVGRQLHNCFKLATSALRSGFKKLGVEHVGADDPRRPDRRRGSRASIVADLLHHHADDLRTRSRKRQRGPGDGSSSARLVKLMGQDNHATARMPHRHRAAQWLVTQDPMMVAADNCCVEYGPRRRRTAAGSRDDG